MKNLLLLVLIACLALGTTNFIFAQDAVDSTQQVLTTSADNSMDEENTGFGILKKYFIDGGWIFMSLVLAALIFGLAFCIERILTLNLLTSNPTRLLRSVEAHLENGDVDAAREVARNNRGPVASIIYQGLSRSEQSLDQVEKTIVNYGSVQMGKLEKNLVWIALCISLAPMLGFMGTVIGMIGAFDAIEKAGDISPSLVAGGIKVALLTTLFGLIVAVILQIFYNYIVSKIDGMVNEMENASISFVDLLVKHKHRK